MTEEWVSLKIPGADIVGILEGDTTRTSLSENGLTVHWCKDDKIGVFSSDGNENNAFTLQSGEGTSTAVFKRPDNFAKEPKYAYFPYSSAAGNNKNALNMTLPAVQTQKGVSADMSYDVKIGSEPVVTKAGLEDGPGDKKKVSFSFTPVFALLFINFTPSEALSGDKLQYISLEASGCSLAGDYTMNLVQKSITFSEGASSTVRLDYSDKPTLASSEPVKAWMFVNAAMPSGQSLQFKIVTDKHIATVNVTSKVAMESGSRYTLPLDIASLVGASKAYIEDNVPVLDVDVPGIYSGADPVFVYEEGSSQYAIRETSEYRIQNISEGKAVKFVLSGSLEKDSSVTLKLTSYGETGVSDGNVSATVLANDGSTLWLGDGNGKYYILTLDI